LVVWVETRQCCQEKEFTVLVVPYLHPERHTMAMTHKLPAAMGVPTTLSLTRPLLRNPTAGSFPLLLRLFLLISLHNTPLALADCECGYLSTVNGTTTSSNQHVLFTDLLETDFTRVLTPASLAQDPDWARQAFNLTRERARGDYGEMFAVENVVVGSQHEGHGQNGQEGERGEGVQLVVRSGIVDGMVPVAELDTRRLDLFWGTFRASMRVARLGGTCAAFFWVSFLPLSPPCLDFRSERDVG
jgi:hypothetical protein